MEEMNLRNYAYIGDAVWELFIREKTVRLTANAKKLHKITTDKVKASFQAELLQSMEEKLSPEEKEIARRARNLPIPVGRRQIQQEYRMATAFETLIGYWHEHDKQRLNQIFNELETTLNF
ncbi:hypothetical protein J6E39_02050 [bacterium]|nr:hypothetical protein [bacterium]